MSSADVVDIRQFVVSRLNEILTRTELDKFDSYNRYCCGVYDHVTSSDQSDRKSPPPPEILIDMSDSIVDNSFHFRLSTFMTKSFTETNEVPTLEDLPAFLEHYPGLNTTTPDQDGDIGRGSAATAASAFAAAVPITPSVLADCLAIQRAANERLRSSALLPAQRHIQSLSAADDSNYVRRPSLAELARSQRLKRVLDVHLETTKIGQEIHRVWSDETTVDSLKQFTRRRAITTIEQETKTLSEQSERYSATPKHGDVIVSGATLSSVDDAHRLELTVFYCHESVEKILRALLELGSTLHVSGSDVMQEFDAIGKRRTSSSSGPTSPGGRGPPLSTLVNYTTAINSLLASLPPKYNLDVLATISTSSGRHDSEAD